MADGQEKAVDGNVKNAAVLSQEAGTRDAHLVSQHFLRVAVPQHFNIGGGEHLLLHNLGGAENIPAHYHVHLFCQGGQVQGVLAGGVSSAHHGHGALAVEKAVAGGAGAHSGALELLFRGQSQIAGLGPGGNDEGLGLYLRFPVNHHLERPMGKVCRRGGAAADIGPETFGLLPHLVHEGVGVHSARETGEVFHDGGGGELSAGLDSLIYNGGQVGAGRIDGGGESGGASTQNQAFDFFHGD